MPHSTQNRLVNVKNTRTGMFNRLPQAIAERLVNETGEHVYVSKGTMKHFFNKKFKIMSNEEALKLVDFSKKQKDNFITQEGDKIMGYKLQGYQDLTYTIPEDKKKAEEKKSWVREVVEKYCINPEDNSIKKSLLAKLAIFFGFLKSKEEKEKPKQPTIKLPKYTRYIMGYGKLATQ